MEHCICLCWEYTILTLSAFSVGLTNINSLHWYFRYFEQPVNGFYQYLMFSFGVLATEEKKLIKYVSNVVRVSNSNVAEARKIWYIVALQVIWYHSMSFFPYFKLTRIITNEDFVYYFSKGLAISHDICISN